MGVKAVSDVARAHCPSLRIVDFVDDIRLAGASGVHDALAASMTNMLTLLERMGARFHTKEGGADPINPVVGVRSRHTR